MQASNVYIMVRTFEGQQLFIEITVGIYVRLNEESSIPYVIRVARAIEFVYGKILARRMHDQG